MKKMKKTYSKPSVKAMNSETIDMLAVSGVNSGIGVGYGGTDKDGEKEPSSRTTTSVWDDEEED